MAGFFPPDPPQDDSTGPEPEVDPRWGPPETELPRLFPISEALAVTDTAAIIVMAARVYSTGVEFVIERRIRRGDRTPQEWQTAHWGFHGSFGPSDPERLRYGVALGDGRRLILDDGSWMTGGEGGSGDDDTAHTLAPTGGSGGGSGNVYRVEDGLWLRPLPPAGPIEIVAQWPAQGIEESRIVLDGTPLLDLAASVRPLWG